MLYNGRDFASIQAALDHARSGDRIYIPSSPGGGAYVAPTDAGWVVNKNLEIFGDGPGSTNSSDTNGTILEPASATGNVLDIAPTTQYVHIHDLRIRRASPPGAPGTTGTGIRGITTVAGQKIQYVRLERIAIFNMSGPGYHFQGLNGGDAAVVGLTMSNCSASFCGGDGAYLQHVYGARLDSCTFLGNQRRGCYARQSGIVLLNCGIENNLLATTPLDPTLDAGLRLETCHVARIDAYHFENFGTTAQPSSVRRACMIKDCGGSGFIGGCYFMNVVTLLPPTPDDTGIYVDSVGNGNGPVFIAPNRFSDVNTLLRVPTGARGSVIVAQYSAAGGKGLIIPQTPNYGSFGLPVVVTPIGTGAGGDVRVPLQMPSGDNATHPGTGLTGGSLWYNNQTGKLQVVIGGAWRDVLTS